RTLFETCGNTRQSSFIANAATAASSSRRSSRPELSPLVLGSLWLESIAGPLDSETFFSVSHRADYLLFSAPPMSSPEELAREKIHAWLQQSSWILQNRSMPC